MPAHGPSVRQSPGSVAPACRRISSRRGDQRGVYAPFIAIIATALLISLRRRPGSVAAARRFISSRRRDQRGVYAPFIAIIATALLILGGIAYDYPRLVIARQDAAHAANEAARVAAITVAAGGTLDDAEAAAGDRLAKGRLAYNQEIHLVTLDCVGSRVQVWVLSQYFYRSVIGLARQVQPIAAAGAAEAYLILPDESPSELNYLAECPL